MVECVPIHTLTASFQYEKVVSVLNDIHSNGGNVVAILCDNNRINQRFFTMFPGYISLQPWKANNPYNNELPLFLLNDTVHLLKSLRNNWLTSTCASLKLSVDDESREVFFTLELN